jgi:hypothetical protein
MKQKTKTLLIIFICILLLFLGSFLLKGRKNINEMNTECPTGYNYAKGGLPGDNAPYYCIEETNMEGKRPIIIPMSPYPAR